MSDSEGNSDDKVFCIEKAKQGRAACKKCKEKCPSGELRVAKVIPNPFAAGKMKTWYHVACIFEQFIKQRPTTKRIESPHDIDGWEDLSEEDKENVAKQIEECEAAIAEKYGAKNTPKKQKGSPQKTPMKNRSPKNTTMVTTPVPGLSPKKEARSTKKEKSQVNKDALFREFRRLVADISNVNSYTEKTNLVSKVFTKGSDGTGFKGDITLWCRLLLPGVVKRVYNLQSKQLTKLFAKIFDMDHNLITAHLEQAGDIGETIQHFFEQSSTFFPAKKSSLTIEDVDNFLEELSTLTKEDEQMKHFKTFFVKCTSNELKIVVRLIKHDLRMNAGAKHILDGVHPDAYQAYQASRDIDAVIKRCLGGTSSVDANAPATVKATISPLTPVLPMLAEACKSVEQAVKKCPNGMFAEIKYDGERVQVHKQGSNFKYFSRSLKPVMPHKIAHFKEYIPKAFPHGKDLILDSEILMIDTITGKPLPFGTLGIHKKSEFKHANVCLFVFDCIYFNGEVLMNKSIKYRKQILKENMTEIPHRIVFSEMEEIHKSDDLTAMIAKVLKLGLEGLVLKDILSTYEPGKRHWLKVKKDYLFGGAMADTADLIVLGAWFGTGKKGGMMSVFLMGCYDTDSKIFCTVTKVHTGHDDKTLERLQTELHMIKISGDISKVPSWLKCTKTMIPDFVARDPKKQPVWEITGAEFTQHEVHTADGISIRFPRVTRIRDDKTWETATNLKELQTLYQNSKESTDISMLMKNSNQSDTNTADGVSEEQNSKKTNASSNKRKKSSVTNDNKNKKQKRKANIVENDDVADTASATKNVSKIKNPLPNLFKNIKLLLEEGAKERFVECLRHFVTYGGVIVPSDDWENATHVLHIKDTVAKPEIVCPKSARHIIVEWIKDTVAAGSLQDFRPYSVRWQPMKSN